jgi:hypothetical protein
MLKTKYIKTDDGLIIVFSQLHEHKQFQHFNPVSAGFISFGVDKDGNPSCTCYGKSISLDLKADEEDTALAKRQILGYSLYD